MAQLDLMDQDDQNEMQHYFLNHMMYWHQCWYYMMSTEL